MSRYIKDFAEDYLRYISQIAASGGCGRTAGDDSQPGAPGGGGLTVCHSKTGKATYRNLLLKGKGFKIFSSPQPVTSVSHYIESEKLSFTCYPCNDNAASGPQSSGLLQSL